MKVSDITMYLATQESPKTSLNSAIKKVEAEAYARGLVDGLIHLEMIASLIPDKLSAQDVINQAHNHLNAAITMWKRHGV